MSPVGFFVADGGDEGEDVSLGACVDGDSDGMMAG